MTPVVIDPRCHSRESGNPGWIPAFAGMTTGGTSASIDELVSHQKGTRPTDGANGRLSAHLLSKAAAPFPRNKFLDTDPGPVVLWRHVRRRGHHRAQTQPLQPPARRRPSAHLLRQAARHHAPQQPPPVRRRRDRPDPRARHPRPAPRRGTRSQGDPRRRPAGRLARAAAHFLPPRIVARRTAAARPTKATKPTSLACPRKSKSPPRYAAVRSVPSSPTSAAISASRRTIRCGPN